MAVRVTLETSPGTLTELVLLLKDYKELLRDLADKEEYQSEARFKLSRQADRVMMVQEELR
jgi:hypothetical protein